MDPTFVLDSFLRSVGAVALILLMLSIAFKTLLPSDFHKWSKHWFGDSKPAADQRENDHRGSSNLINTSAPSSELSSSQTRMSRRAFSGDESPHNDRVATIAVSRSISIGIVEQTEFHMAISSKDYYKMKTMLVETPRLARCMDEYHKTPLHIAAEIGDMISIELLLQYNADINAVDSRRRSCLHMCTDDLCLRYLCDEGANLTTTDCNGLLPLHSFALSANLACIRVLLEYDADPMTIEPSRSRNSLHLAASTGRFDILSTMILHSKRAVNVNSQDCVGDTALHIVCSNAARETQQLDNNAHMRSVMLLVDKGADVDLVNNKGCTPLHLACLKKVSIDSVPVASLESLIQILLELDANVNAMDDDGCTPCVVCAAYQQWTLCKVLLESGADINIPCSTGSFLLTDWLINAREKQLPILKELISSEVTASDLIEPTICLKLFGSIRVPQTLIPLHSRRLCMNCKEDLHVSSSSFGVSGSDTDCKFCCRLICRNCVTKLPKPAVPSFITDVQYDGSVKVCIICYEVLISDFIRTKST